MGSFLRQMPGISKFPFSLSIRGKLLLVSLTLLVIPAIGYQYIQDLENYLRQEQEQSLLEYARIVAETVKQQPAIFNSLNEDGPSPTLNHLFIRSLNSPIQLDGYSAGDWEIYPERKQYFSAKPATAPQIYDPLSFTLQDGHYDRFLYLFLQVNDKHLVYLKANDTRVQRSDHIDLGIMAKDQIIRHYVIATYSPGKTFAKRLDDGNKSSVEERITGVWRESPRGYNVELRIPISMLGNKISLSVADVDDKLTRQVTSTVSITGTASQELSTITIASPTVEQLLQRLKRHSTRIWVIDNKARVLDLSGELVDDENNDLSSTEGMDISFAEVVSGIVRLIYQMILTQPATQFSDDLSNVSQLKGEEIQSALQGNTATQWRKTPAGQVSILTAAYPVIIDKNVKGAIAIEETSNSILILQNRAFEILINLSILAFVIATLTLLAFASSLSIRIRRLRDESDNAISEDGRVLANVSPSNARDEIGDLTRSVSGMLKRLSQYNKYLETMASKLAHELRTPITVVKSSLENIESININSEARVYTVRAQEGIDRLSNILTRMSEATRLEQTLQHEQPIKFNLEEVISGCVNGYQIAHPEHRIILTLNKHSPAEDISITGVPDLIAQLLDKLVANARDFSEPETAIEVTLAVHDRNANLSVSNIGPLLAEHIQSNLFDSMVSSRDKRGDEPHLGLGLYIVRLITEFHQGRVNASNRDDGKGVVFTVNLPLAQVS
jgi:two-component system sensor histidine kinase ChvG